MAGNRKNLIFMKNNNNVISLVRFLTHFMILCSVFLFVFCSPTKRGSKIPKNKEKYTEQKSKEQKEKEQEAIDELKERHRDNQDKATRKRMKKREREMKRKRKGKRLPFWKRWFRK